MLVIIEVYAYCGLPSIQESHFWPGPDILQNWGGYLKLGIPGVVMVCAEEWAFTLLIILAGLLGAD